MPDRRTGEFRGTCNLKRLKRISQKKQAEDIDSIDPGFAPGTGTPEPGGFTPREALEMVRLIAAEGLCGMEVVEVSPPYDVNDNTSQLACRVILDALGTMVVEGKIGHRDKVMTPE